MRQYRIEQLLPANRGQWRFELLEDGERIALFLEARHATVALEALKTEERDSWPTTT